MKRFSILTFALLSVFGACVENEAVGQNEKEPQTRLIVMSDIGGSDPDDTESMVHLLTMLDRFHLEGIISQHAWVPYGKGALELINSIVDAYEKVLPNLSVHGNFPNADYVRARVVVGQPEAAMHGTGIGKDTDGSNLIIKVVDADDERPVWIACWSGLSTLAQALQTVSATRSEEEVARFVSKIRVYDILGQDDAGAWITKNYPDLLYIRNTEGYGWAYDDEWLRENVQSVGPLGACYPNRRWSVEGDSPSFLFCIDNGLCYPERPEFGGWGGRFETEPTANIRGMDFIERSGLDEKQYDPYYMISSAPEGIAAINLWKDAIHNDFAARMQWTVTPSYSDANHHPVAVVDGCEKTIFKDVAAGSTLSFDAGMSSDPDGDALNYKWINYTDASTFNGEVVMEGDGNERIVVPAVVPLAFLGSESVSPGREYAAVTGKSIKVSVPMEAAGGTIHLILQLTDNGTPALTSYRRIVLNVN